MKESVELGRILEILFKIYIITLALISSYWIFLKLTGHSPTYEQLDIIFKSIVISSLVGFGYKLGRIDSTLNYHAKQINAIGKDLKNHASYHG